MEVIISVVNVSGEADWRTWSIKDDFKEVGGASFAAIQIPHDFEVRPGAVIQVTIKQKEQEL